MGLSPSTLRKYITENEEGLQPSKSVMFGKIEMYLYTHEDIERIKKLKEARVRSYHAAGRPKKYTADERAYRARLFSRRYYWMDKLSRHDFMGREEDAEYARQQIESVNKELKESEQR